MALDFTGGYLMNSSIHNVTQIQSVGEYFATVDTLFYYIIGMTAYSLFIYKFYRFLAKRKIIEFNFHKHNKGLTGAVEKISAGSAYLLENIVLIPLLVFFWFLVLAAFILFLSDSHSPESVLLVSMAIVGAVRITAYYSEDLSKDLAKMIPFALLGVFIINMNFAMENVLSAFQQIPMFADKLIYYLVFVVLLELIMSLGYILTKPFRKKNIEELYVPDKK